MNMHISLKLFATLARYRPGHPEACPVAPKTTVRQLLIAQGVPLKEAKLIFINGVKASLDTVIKDGDRVGVFPPVGGG
jgi:molybdopterin converting factor small subunit